MAQELIDNALTNVGFMEVVGVGEVGDDGGRVEFSVKELLVEQREELRRISEKIDDRPTKEDLVVLKDHVNLRADENRARIVVLEAAEITNRLRWARVGGMAAIIGALFGGIGASVMQAIGNG